MIITFKAHPELGRLKVVKEGGDKCERCALHDLPVYACESLQKHLSKRDITGDYDWACIVHSHHYEPENPGKESGNK